MNEEEIAKAINPQFPDVYAVTYGPTTLYFKDGSIKVGFFHNTDETENLKKENTFTFVEFGENAQGFKATGDKKYVTKVKGNDLDRVVYARPVIVKYDKVFSINSNNTITPRIPVLIGGISMGPGISLGDGVFIGGVRLMDFLNRDIHGYVDNGMFVITGFSNG